MDLIKPQMSFAMLKECSPLIGEMTAAVLFSFSGLAASLQPTLGREVTLEHLERAYDEGIVHVLWSNHAVLAAVLVWSDERQAYFILDGGTAGRPQLIQRVGSGAKLTNL
jgi:non-ribosomal peptide synthetase component E (peptide arylation enzyme)